MLVNDMVWRESQTIVLSVTFWNLCKTSIFELLGVPHSSTPCVKISLII